MHAPMRIHPPTSMESWNVQVAGDVDVEPRMGVCMGVCWRHAMLPDTDTDTRTHPLSDVDACRGTELTQRRVAQPPEKEQPPVRHGTIPGGALRK